MTEDSRIRELAQRSRNFGYLLAYEPLLVAYGAGAEAYVFTDPNGALVKCRQFVETLTQELLTRLGRSPRRHLATDIAALDDAGVLVPHVRTDFDQVRDLGNKATHHHLSDEQRALDSVRSCFGLGVWFHRALCEDREVRAFVPPQPPPETGPRVVEELRSQLDRMRTELAEAQTRLSDATSRETAEAQARREAEEIVRRAFADRNEAFELVRQLEPAAEAPTLDSETSLAVEPEPEKVAPATRERIVERAREPEPLNEIEARRLVDRMLAEAGWLVQDFGELNPLAGTGVAVREFPLTGGRADYVLYVDGKIVGVIEAKREGVGLAGVEWQSGRYAEGLPKSYQLAAWHSDDPLPFRYETTGTRTQFTNGLDSQPRSREVFSFHRPESLQRWMVEAQEYPEAPTWRARLHTMPGLDTGGLRPAQIDAIRGVEDSLAHDRPRALVQMATGAGKTYMAVTLSYRLLAHAKARRILFLVDRNNLGKQTRGEFANYVTPGDGRKFTELYNVERLSGRDIVDSSHVVISTIQRMYALLRGDDLPDVDDDNPAHDDLPDGPVTVAYNPDVPPESFDLVIVDECHRSIYGKWRGVLEYFDAHLVGLTATPVKQTFGFFHQNLVAEYPYESAVADGVNVDFDVYRIRTQVTDHGGDIEAGTVVPRRDRRTRRERYEELEDDYTYTGVQLGSSVIAKDQIRLVLETFRDRLFTDIFPGREAVPKTLIYARDDNHAEDIVRQVRETFGRGNDFAAKITYTARRDGNDPDELLQRFRNDPVLRIAVTVDMIATGTDVRPLECVFFLRDVKSPAYFEQMKGRGARTVDPTEFQSVTPDATAKRKERFVIIDAVGVTDSPLVDATPLQRHPRSELSLEQLLTRAGTRNITTAETSTLASRLARLNQQLTEDERAEIEDVGGQPLTGVVGRMVGAVDLDAMEKVRASGGDEAVRESVLESVRPLTENPPLRQRLLDIRRAHDITIDEVTRDELEHAEMVPAEHRARMVVDNWRAYLAEHKDEIAALQVFYSERDGRITWAQLKELADQIRRPPRSWTPERLWTAYEVLGEATSGPGRAAGVADLVSVLRYELGLDGELRPYRSVVEERFAGWLEQQEQHGVRFTGDQRWWLDRICDVVATSAEVTAGDLDEAPFTEHGGVEGFEHTFGPDRAAELLDELDKELPA